MSDKQFYLLLATIYLVASPLAPVPNFIMGLIFLVLAIYTNAKHP